MGRSYRDLVAGQKAMKFVTEIYEVTQRFPSEERYGLTNQLRRAAVSVPSKYCGRASSLFAKGISSFFEYGTRIPG
jgi:four helix bundle protein